jgi:hypothetical protein
MPYEKCSDVSEEFWEDLEHQDPAAVTRRTGAFFENGLYHLPCLDRQLMIDSKKRQIQVKGAAPADLGFRLCLTTLLYLLHLDIAGLGPPISPLELPGGATFFRGHHGLPNGLLEARFGQDVSAFQGAGKKLQAKTRPAGDAAVDLEVFPGLVVGVILWRGDEEFPAQVSFTLPAHLDRFWFLDAIWGMLNLVTQELIQAAGPAPS